MKPVQILWEQACLRKGRQIQHHRRLTLRLRRQACSHNGWVEYSSVMPYRKNNPLPDFLFASFSQKIDARLIKV
ncbi:MAG: hypothetical protein JWQ69_3897 [Pseudomonas sp.]|nr:hypothetical protein [Pseudomonas sp.]